MPDSEPLMERLLAAPDADARRRVLAGQPESLRHEIVRALKNRVDEVERDDARQALAIALVAEEVAGTVTDSAARALAVWGQANAHALLGENESAVQHYARAADLFRAAGRPLEAARTGIGRVDAHMYLGRYDEAQTLAESAIQVFAAEGDAFSQAKLEMNLGNICARQERHAEALRYFRSARAACEALGETLTVAMTQVNEANVLTVLDDFRGAEELYVQARPAFDAAELRAAVAMVDHDVAFLQYARGRYGDALRVFERARAAFAAIDIPMEAAYIDLHESDIYLELNLPQEALRLAGQAGGKFAALGMNFELARSQANKAVALARLGSGSALVLLAQARELFAAEGNEVWQAHVDLARAEVLGRAGARAKARTIISGASEAYRRLGLQTKHAYAEIFRATLLADERLWVDALGALQVARMALKDLSAPWLWQRIWGGYGRVYEGLNEPESALPYYRRAVEELESIVTSLAADEHRTAFVADKLAPYEALALLTAPGDNAESFGWAERAKSRALVDLLAAAVRPRLRLADPSTSSGQADARRAEELQAVRDELNWLYSRLTSGDKPGEAGPPPAGLEVRHKIAEGERKAMSLWRDLQAKHAEPLSLQRVTAVSAEEAQAGLPPGAALIEYFIARGQVMAFVLRRDRLRVHLNLVPASSLSPLLNGLAFQLSKFQYGPNYFNRHRDALRAGTIDVLGQLRSALIAPLWPEIADAESLIVIPHGLLHHLPFHALYADGRYLIETHAISYAPSASVLKFCREKAAQGEGLPYRRPLFVGVPDERATRVTQEAKTLASLFPDARTLIGEEATAAKVRELAPDSGLLHFAAHGLFRPEAPLLSAVRLADTWLAAQDVYDLELRASLVTLSACESGLGRVAGGDDLIGLVRGFLYAGTPSLLVSLWMVDDESITKLMAEFYKALLAGQPKAQALRQAQMTLIKENDHPYIWAPLALVGSER